MWRWVTGIGSALQMAGAQLFLADISLSSNRARTLGTNQVSHHGRPHRGMTLFTVARKETNLHRPRLSWEACWVRRWGAFWQTQWASEPPSLSLARRQR